MKVLIIIISFALLLALILPLSQAASSGNSKGKSNSKSDKSKSKSQGKGSNNNGKSVGNKSNNNNNNNNNNNKHKTQNSNSKASKSANGAKSPSYHERLIREHQVHTQQLPLQTHHVHHSHSAMELVRKTLADFQAQPYHNGDQAHKLEKTVFSSKVRLLFIAGLEGTGHHAMKSIMSDCYESNLCARPGNITYDLYRRSNDGTHGLFGLKDEKYTTYLLERFYRHLIDLKVSTGDGEHLYIYALEHEPGAGMLSYPSFNDEAKVFNHVDLVPMTILAEAAGIDFRVLVLQRRAYDILVSTTINRHFGNGMQPRVLLENAAALYGQLSLLSTKFFICLHYHNMPSYNASTLQSIGRFLHPQLDNASVMQKMWSQLRPPSNHSSSTSSGTSSSGSENRDNDSNNNVVNGNTNVKAIGNGVNSKMANPAFASFAAANADSTTKTSNKKKNNSNSNSSSKKNKKDKEKEDEKDDNRRSLRSRQLATAENNPVTTATTTTTTTATTTATVAASTNENTSINNNENSSNNNNNGNILKNMPKERVTAESVLETKEMHEKLKVYEYEILRLAMEIKRIDYLCPVLH